MTEHGDSSAGRRAGEDPAVSRAENAPSAPVATPIPPDPAAYDTERNAAARRRGLASPYIPGGRDPELDRTERAERRLMRVLLAMVVVIVLAGFVLGFAAALGGFNGLVGDPG
jgi:hypothetical protein